METLPYDTEIEDSVLGSVISYDKEYDKVSRYFVDEEVFYQKKARLLWKRITEMRRKKEPVDTMTVCASLTDKDIKNGLSSYYVTKCTSDVGAKGVTSFHANKIYEKYLLRKVIVQSDQVKQKAISNDSDVYQSVVEAHTLFGELIEMRPTNVQDIEDVISETLESIENKTSKLIGTGYQN